jgi:polyhydroxyalkanoate synthesis regulator phasin
MTGLPMSSESTTTVSVDRRPTKRRLNRRKEALEEQQPGERIRMDDVIRDALDDRERVEEAEERIEELERELQRLRNEAEEGAAA